MNKIWEGIIFTWSIFVSLRVNVNKGISFLNILCAYILNTNLCAHIIDTDMMFSFYNHKLLQSGSNQATLSNL